MNQSARHYKHHRIPPEIIRYAVFVRIQGKQHCVWPAVDQDGDGTRQVSHQEINLAVPKITCRSS
jgi:hypothetical protein